MLPHSSSYVPTVRHIWIYQFSIIFAICPHTRAYSYIYGEFTCICSYVCVNVCTYGQLNWSLPLAQRHSHVNSELWLCCHRQRWCCYYPPSWLQRLLLLLLQVGCFLCTFRHSKCRAMCNNFRFLNTYCLGEGYIVQ